MDEVLYKSNGTLHYSRHNESFKLIVSVDQGIVDYYRALMPKAIRTAPQKYAAHISVVRKEIPPNLASWDKYEGQEIEFSYSPIIHSGTVYYWLNAFSVRLEEIRTELGLIVDAPFHQPPPGFKKTFHISLGNTKER